MTLFYTKYSGGWPQYSHCTCHFAYDQIKCIHNYTSTVQLFISPHLFFYSMQESLTCSLLNFFFVFSFLSLLLTDSLFFFLSEESLAHQCWLLILAIDNWKRGLLYLALSAACYIINPKEAWQTVVAGAIMDLCGLLYFIKTIKAKKRTEPYKYKQLSVT